MLLRFSFDLNDKNKVIGIMLLGLPFGNTRLEINYMLAESETNKMQREIEFNKEWVKEKGQP